MKGKNVFFALGLALTMGVGVAAAFAGASHNYKEAKAEIWRENPTIYFIPSTNWAADGATFKMNYYDNATYKGKITMADTGVDYDSRNIYSATVTDGSWVSKVQFLRMSGDGNTEWNYSGTFTISDDYDDGINTLLMDSAFATYNEWTTGTGITWEDYDDLTGAPTYKVNVYVDKVLRGEEDVTEGSLPAAPTLTEYGKGFTGWYSDIDLTGPKVTEITSDTSVYGEIIDLPRWSYAVDASRVPAFNDLYFYAFESNDRKNDTWPGEKMSYNSFIVPNDATIVIANGDSSVQTVDVTQSFVANDVLRILNSTDLMGHYEYVWESTLDEPAEEGYYVVGVGDYWDFDHATQMIYNGGAALDANGNIAICDGITVEAGDEIKVRSFFSEADAWFAPADGLDYTFGYKETEHDDNSNFIFTTGGTYDIYFKEGHFYVGEHIDRYTIGIVHEMYTGRTKTSFVNGANQLAEAGQDFNPAEPTQAGYSFIGFYEDSACTTAYAPKVFAFDDTLYAKFVKNEAYDNNDGVYVVGDATFTGNPSYAWDIQGAVLLGEAINDTEHNLFEGTVTIPNSATDGNPVEIKAAFYDGALDYEHANCSLGQAYSFVSKPGDNFVFTRGGVYAVYVTKSLQVFFNTGEDAFYTKFLTEVGAVCDAQGATDLVELAAVWADQKAAFVALGNAEDTFIYGAGIDGGNESGSDMQKVIAKYKYIVTKYGTAVCEDFIWGETYEVTSNNFFRTVSQNNSTLIITIVAITAVAVGAVAAYALLKKKKER